MLLAAFSRPSFRCTKAALKANNGLGRLISSVAEFENIQTLKMENGHKQPLLFTKGEYDRRLGSLRDHMSKENLDACVFTSYHNIAYFSNFLFTCFGRPYALVVTHDQDVTVSALVDGGMPWRTCRSDNIIYTDWTKDNYMRAIKEVLGDKAKTKIGIEHDTVSLQTHAKMQDFLGLSAQNLVDVGDKTMRMRMIKSDEEIAVHKSGARIADMGGFAVRQAIAEGVSEYEIAQAGTDAMVREMAKTYGERSHLRDTWVWLQSGPLNTDGAHNPVTTRRLESGDIILLNCFPMAQGYYIGLERTLFLHHATDAHLKYWEANLAVHYKGCDLVKPGVKCSDIAKELNAMVESMGMLKYRSFGYGHSFGLVCHYYGREAGLELREDVHTVLEPGMILSMEPMFTVPYGQPGAGGYREHDVFVVTKDGAENITKFPLGPEHNIVGK